MKFTNGSIYEGNLQNELKHGYGEMRYNMLATNNMGLKSYKGTWQHGLKEGNGKEDYISKKGIKSDYKGEFKNNRKEGQGMYESNDGYSYEGEWKNGVKHGFGIENILASDDSIHS